MDTDERSEYINYGSYDNINPSFILIIVVMMLIIIYLHDVNCMEYFESFYR
jgi:hypothetical protein